jgi:hypothetical protein
MRKIVNILFMSDQQGPVYALSLYNAAYLYLSVINDISLNGGNYTDGDGIATRCVNAAFTFGEYSSFLHCRLVHLFIYLLFDIILDLPLGHVTNKHDGVATG